MKERVSWFKKTVAFVALAFTSALGLTAQADTVAKIGDTGYASLQAAVTAAKAGDTIMMIANETLTAGVLIDKSITITVKEGGKITAPANVDGKSVGYTGAIVASGSGVKVTVSGINVTATLGDGKTGLLSAICAKDGATLDLVGVSASGVAASSDNFAVYAYENGVINVRGGNYLATGGGTCASAYGSANAVLNIFEGNFDAKGDKGPGCAWAAKSGVVNIYGGTFHADPLTNKTHDQEELNAVYCLYDYRDMAGTSWASYIGTLTVYGGTFNGFNPKGGNVGVNVDFVKADYLTTKFGDSTWVVSSTNFSVDENNAKLYHIKNLAGLKEFRDSVNNGTSYDGKTIQLDADIDLNNEEWDPIVGQNETVTFDGNGKTIKNLKISQPAESDLGLFEQAVSWTIKNLTIDGATVSGKGRVGALVGQGLCAHVEGCTVKNATITTTVYNNDDGDKAGAIVGYLSGENTAWVKNCTVENCTVTGYRDVGGAVGYANGNAVVISNTVKNTTVAYDTTAANYKNYTTIAAYDINAVVGEKVSAATMSDNTTDNVTVTRPTAVAKIGDAEYTSLAGAIAAVKDGETVVMQSNTDIGAATINITKAFTLDLNGKKITAANNGSNYAVLKVITGGDLTIDDTSANADGSIESTIGASATGATIWADGGKVTLNKGSVKNVGTTSGLHFAIDIRPNEWGKANPWITEFVMNGGYVYCEGDEAVCIRSSSASQYEPNVKVTINGGTLEGWDGLFIQQSNAIYHPITVAVNGGTFIGGKAAIRIYGPACEKVVGDKEIPIDLQISDGSFSSAKGSWSSVVTSVADAIAFQMPEESQVYAKVAITGGTYPAEPVAPYLVSGYVATKLETTPATWKVGLYVDSGITEENAAELKVKPTDYSVETNALPTEISKDAQLVTNIVTSTEVSGVKLTTTETTNDVGSVEVVYPAGVQAVVDAAKVQAIATAADEKTTEAEKAEAVEFATTLANAEKVEVKVEVKVTPTEYVAPESQTVSTNAVISFSLKPEATVTAISNDVKKTSVVPVTNEMIDQDQTISVSIYTGFQPVEIDHYDDDGLFIEKFTGSQIAYNAETGVATVQISHFSTLTAFGAAQDDYVARIGDTGYPTLAAALNAVSTQSESGVTIEILKDVTNETFNSIYIFTKDVTLVAGHAVTVDFTCPEGNCYIVPMNSMTFGENVTFNADAYTIMSSYLTFYGTAEFDLIQASTQVDIFTTGYVVADAVTIKQYANLNIHSGTLITTGKFTNEGTVNLNVASAVGSPIKVINYTGNDTMTLASYGTLEFLNNTAVSYYFAKVPDTGDDANDLMIVRAKAEIGETPYETLAGAFAAVTNGATIEVLANNSEVISAVPSATRFTIDSNGFTLGATAPAKADGYTYFSNGDGTCSYGLTVATVKVGSTTTDYIDLNAALVAAKGVGSVCTLVDDINLTGKTWTPVGTPVQVNKVYTDAFKGTFNGNGYTISGLNVSGASQVGLIGFVNGGVVSNLTITGATVSGTGSQIGVAVGGIFHGTIDNVKVLNSTITGTSGQYIGALTGGSVATVKNCVVTGNTVKGKDQVGGVMGYLASGSIRNCVVTNAVTATEERAGGIVGKCNTDSEFYVENNSVGGSATAPDYAGGVAAQIMGGTGWAIRNNDIDVTLTAKAVAPIATLRDGQGEAFTSAIAANITGNWWTDATTNANSYTYTNVASGVNPQTVYRGVAQIAETGVGYKTLQAAVDAASSEATVTNTIVVLADLTYDKPTAPIFRNGNTTVDNSGKNLILDLNGKTITAVVDTTLIADPTADKCDMLDLIANYNGGYLRVTGNGTITYETKTDYTWDYSCPIFGNTGTLVIDNGTFENKGISSMSLVVDNRSCRCHGNAVLTVNGGTFKCPTYTDIRLFAETDNNIVTVNAGTFTGKRCFYSQQNTYGCTAGTEINIAGGSFTASQRVFQIDVSGVVAKSSINITGGAFSCGDTAGNSVFHLDTVYADVPLANSMLVTVTDGKFAWGQGVLFDPAVADKEASLGGELTGGIYSGTPAATYIADGYALAGTSDPEYPYAVVTAVASVTTAGASPTTTYYATLSNAFDAAVANSTVTLLQDVDLGGQLWTPVTFNGTFDGNNKTISNLTVTNNTIAYVGFFYNLKGGTVKDVTFANAKVTGNRCGIVAGASLSGTVVVSNVTVTAAKISGVQKCGGIVGMVNAGGNVNLTVKNCTVNGIEFAENATLGNDGGVWQSGGLIGFCGSSDAMTIMSNAVSNVSIQDAYLASIKKGKGTDTQCASHAFIGTINNLSKNADAYSESAAIVLIDNTTTQCSVDDVYRDVKYCQFIGEYSNWDRATSSNSPYPTRIFIDGVEITKPYAKIGDKRYISLQAAIDAVATNDTIVLLADNAETLNVTKTIPFSISKGDYTLTGSVSEVPAGYAFRVNSDGTCNYGKGVAQITKDAITTLYLTVSDALKAAATGDTIEIVAGTYGESEIGTLTTAEASSVRFKSLTIQPAEGATVKFTATLQLGYDDSSTANAAMTVKGLAFENASLALDNYVQVTVENCSFSGSGLLTDSSHANAGALVIRDCCTKSHKTAENYPTSQIIVKGCTFSGTRTGAPAIRLRDAGNATITDNTIVSSAHNGILFEVSEDNFELSEKVVDIRNNSINEWNSANISEGGRAIRISVNNLDTGSTVAITNNYFVKAQAGLDSPDYIKMVGASNATVILNDNSWNNNFLTWVSGNTEMYTVDGDAPALESVKTTKVAEATVNGKEYTTLAAAYAAAKSGDTVALLVDEINSIAGLPKGITLVGVNGKTSVKSQLSATLDGVTMKNFKFVSDTCALRYCYLNDGSTFTIENCEFDQTGDYSLHFDGNKGNIVARNTIFRSTVAIAGGVTNAFYSCEFRSNSHKVDLGISLYSNTLLSNCVFSADYVACSTERYGGLYLKAAGFIVDLIDCSVEGEGNSLTDIFKRSRLTGAGLNSIGVINGVKDGDGKYTSGTFITASITKLNSVVAESNAIAFLDSGNYANTLIYTVASGVKTIKAEGAMKGTITVPAGVNFQVENEARDKASFAAGTKIYLPVVQDSTDYTAWVAANITAEQASYATVYGYVARIGTENYYTLQAAFDAVGENDTIEVLANNSETVTVTKEIPFNFNSNGFTLGGAPTTPEGYMFRRNTDNTCNYGAAVAKIGETTYLTLTDAIAAAAEGDTITMIANETLTKVLDIPADKVFTLDLNGKTIKNVESGFDWTMSNVPSATPARMMIVLRGDVTLVDTSANADGCISASNYSYGTTKAILVTDNGNLSVYSGKVYGEYAGIYVVGDTGTVASEVKVFPTLTLNGGEIAGSYGVSAKGLTATITVNDGATIHATGEFALGTNGTQDWNNSGNCKIVVNGGTITSDGGAAVYNPAECTFDIKGGTLTGKTGVAIKGGHVSISGNAVIRATGDAKNPGTETSGYTSTGDALYVEDTYDGHTPVVTVTGGTFDSANNLAVRYYTTKQTGNGSLSISAGTYSSDPTDYVVAERDVSTVVVDTKTWYIVGEAVWTGGDVPAVVIVEQSSSVDTNAAAKVISDETVVANIGKNTKVTGVKLSPTNETHLISGAQSVVTLAQTTGSAEYAENLKNGTNVLVDVNVAVTPKVYEAPVAEEGAIKFNLIPYATVTVDEGGLNKTNTVAVTNEMIDQLQDIEVTMYTGFQPLTAVHTATNGTVIQTFSADEIKYDAVKGTATVIIHHFSDITFYQAAVVAKIGDTGYGTLEAAFAAATAGDRIVLVSDAVVDKCISVDKKVTLDIGAYDVTATNALAAATSTDALFVVKYGGDLTVDGTTGSIDASTATTGAGSIYAAIKLTEKGDTYDGTTRAKLTVNGGTIKGDYYAIVGNGNRPGTDILVNGGTIAGTHENDNQAIFNPQCDSTVVISNGTLTGYSSAIEMRGGSLTVAGGTLTATATEFSCSPSSSGSTTVGAAVAVAQHTTKGDVSVTVTGGELIGVKALNEADPQENEPENVAIDVTGGTFTGAVASEDVEKYIGGGTFSEEITQDQCKDWYTPVQTGDKWGVKAQTVFITDVAAQQRYPWNGLVDVTFDLKAQNAVTLFVGAYRKDGTQLAMTAAKRIDGATETAIVCNEGFAGAATGTTAVTYHVVWDSNEAAPGTKIDEVTFKVFAK